MRWVTSAKTGKALPLDPEPCDDGNIRLELQADGSELAVYIAKSDRRAWTRYKSHFATCPDGPSHRKSKK